MQTLVDDLQSAFRDEFERQWIRRELEAGPSVDPKQVERVMLQLSAVAARLASVIS
jgi:hypothetical protein